jgi:transcriptional regulator with XRE-family HTH domain
MCPMAMPAVGPRVRAWRQSRGLSQFDLAMRAGFSNRHLSFIETGRTRPSRDAVLALAEAMDLPLRERNRLLESAGFAHVYRETPLTAEEMAQMRGLLQIILDRQLPYSAVAIDRHSTCLVGNRAAGQLLSLVVAPELLTKNANFLRVTFHPEGVRRWIVNWPDVEAHLIRRAERELGAADDPAGQALLDEIRRYSPAPPATATGANATPGRVQAHDLLLPIHIRKPDLDLRLFSTIMTLGTPYDVTLQELRIETFFPADAESERGWAQLFT